MTNIARVESNLRDCEKAVQHYKFLRDRKGPKRNLNGVYLQEKIHVNFNTFVQQHYQGTPSAKGILTAIKKTHYNSKQPLVKIDNRMLRTMLCKPYSKSTICSAMNLLEEDGLLMRTQREEFDELKQEFDLPVTNPCRLLRVTLPDYIEVPNDKKNKLERNARAIIGKEYGLKPQEVTIDVESIKKNIIDTKTYMVSEKLHPLKNGLIF